MAQCWDKTPPTPEPGIPRMEPPVPPVPMLKSASESRINHMKFNKSALKNSLNCKKCNSKLIGLHMFIRTLTIPEHVFLHSTKLMGHEHLVFKSILILITEIFTKN